MESTAATLAFAALSHPTRLDVFRILVKAEPAGMAAGLIASELATPHNTMSSHLAVLARAGLLKSSRHSRSIVYRADLDVLRELTLFLLRDCCGGRPAICAPVIEDLMRCTSKETCRG